MPGILQSDGCRVTMLQAPEKQPHPVCVTRGVGELWQGVCRLELCTPGPAIIGQLAGFNPPHW